jgi:hypothetical protein
VRGLGQDPLNLLQFTRIWWSVRAALWGLEVGASTLINDLGVRYNGWHLGRLLDRLHDAPSGEAQIGGRRWRIWHLWL